MKKLNKLNLVVLILLVLIVVVSLLLLFFVKKDITEPHISFSREEIVNSYNLINDYRESKGLPPLGVSIQLENSATTKAGILVKDQFFASSHNNASDSVQDLLSKEGFNYVTAGESIAKTVTTGSEVIKAWENNQADKALLLSNTFSKMGIGVECTDFYLPSLRQDCVVVLHLTD